MLQAYGLTPGEFGDLTPEERVFMQSAWRDEQQRKSERIESAKQS